MKQLYILGLEQFNSETRLVGYLSAADDLNNIVDVYLKDRGDFIVGMQDGLIIAMGGLKHLSKKRAEVKRMAVHPDFRRKGYGTMILSKLLESAMNLNYLEISLDTTRQNVASQRLYEKCGFVRLKETIIDGIDVVFYEKKIK